MDFLFINTRELSSLMGLTYIQQSAYLLGIRPYMDRKTFIVGIKRRISYQSLAEALYIEPHSGIKSGSPSRPQLRRIIKSLERAGLVEIQSSEMHLILKCLLADADYPIQNKAVTNPSPEVVIKPDLKNQYLSGGYGHTSQKAVIGEIPKAITPHNSKEKCVYIREKFEKFWMTYPQAEEQAKAWEEFKKLNPDEELFSKIITAIEAQIENREQLQEAGEWVPKWKYPANWLAQQCWNNELKAIKTKEKKNEKNRSTYSRKSAVEIFTEYCGNASFDFEDDKPAESKTGHIATSNQSPGRH